MGTSINHYLPYTEMLQNAAAGTGNGTEMELHGKYGMVVVRVLGITSATITFEAFRTNVKGDAYAAIAGTNVATGAFASTATADGTFIFDVRGVWKFRARVSTYVSGTIYVHGCATAQDAQNGSVTIGSSLPAGTALLGKVGIDQTTDGTTNRVVAKVSQIAGENHVETVGQDATATATIAQTESLSGVVDLGGHALVGIIMPAAWTAAALTFQASNASGGTYANVYDDSAVEVTVQAAASRAIAVDMAALKLAPWRYIKIRSGTSATPVAQEAERTLTLVLKG